MPAPLGFRVGEAAASLNELVYLERATAHVLAGWMPKVADLTLKGALGRELGATMERATALRRRREGLLRATALELPVPLGLQRLMKYLDAAPDVATMLSGLYGFLRPRLIARYREHLAGTDPVGDGPSRRVLGQGLEELQAAAGPASDELPAARLSELELLWHERLSGEALPEAQALWGPLDRVPSAARDPRLLRVEAGSMGVLTVDSVNEPLDVARFLHADLDEEYTTLELCARSSYEHPDMPWAFHADMARQAADECRHATAMLGLLEARGHRHGDFPVTTGSYDGLYAFAPCEEGSRKELLWRILIRQTFMEGLALDFLAHNTKRREAAGQNDIAHVLEYILADEVFHAESGVRWSAYLLGGDRKAVLQERYEALKSQAAATETVRNRYVLANLDKAMAELSLLEEGKRRRGGKPLEQPLNRTGRRQAGFSDDDILQVLSWGYATETD